MKKTIVSIVAILFASICIAADTPIVQALKLQQIMHDTLQACKDAGYPVKSFADVPNAISNINWIGKYLGGEYSGKIFLNKSTYTAQLPTVGGSYDIYGENIISVPDNWLQDVTSVNFVSLPIAENVWSYCFQRSSVKDIYMPQANPGYYCCEKATMLTNIVLKGGALPNTYTFQGCSKLGTVRAMMPITSVPQCCFDGCSSLSNINFVSGPDKTVSFGDSAMRGCSSWKGLTPGTPFNYAPGCFAYSGVTNGNMFINATTYGTAANYLFQGCGNLKEVRLDNMVSINSRYTYQLCQNVTNLYLPNLTTLGNGNMVDYLFDQMTNLKKVYMPKLAAIGTGPYSSSYCMASMHEIEELEFPALEKMGYQNNSYCAWNTWYGNWKLKRISAPNLKILYGTGNFAYNYNLENVDMPMLAELSQETYRDPTRDDSQQYKIFYRCDGLKEISLPNLQYAYFCGGLFSRCPALRKVFFPKLRTIRTDSNNANSLKQMFVYCPALHDITFGLTSTELLAYPNFSSAIWSGGSWGNVKFHCPAEAPYDVSVVYRDGAWKAETNGTYRLADYVMPRADQNPYLITGVTPMSNTVVECEFAITNMTLPSADTYYFMFGSRSGNNANNSFGLYTRYNGQNRLLFVRNTEGSYLNYDFNDSDEVKFRIVAQGNQCNVYNSAGDFLQTLSTSQVPSDGVSSMALFTCNDSSVVGGWTMYNNRTAKNVKIYRFKMTNGDTGDVLVDLVPGVSQDGLACMLDVAHNWAPYFTGNSSQFDYGSITNNTIVVQEP